MIPDLENRIRKIGLSFKEFAEVAHVPDSTLYQWRKEMMRGRPAVTAHVQAVLEQLERERLAELLTRYPQKETGSAGSH